MNTLEHDLKRLSKQLTEPIHCATKQVGLVLALSFLAGGIASAEVFSVTDTSLASTTDTTFIYNSKTIKVTDDQGQVNVKVFEEDSLSGKKAYKQVYEGIFSDEKTYEKFTVVEDLGFQFPIGRKKKNHKKASMEGHWAGFAAGLSNIVTADYAFATFDGAQIKADKSFEWTLNTNEFIAPLISNVIGITSGFGMTWRNYYMEDNVQMEEVNGYMTVLPASPAGMIYKSSRLRSFHLTVPLFLEIQPTFAGHHDLFITAGVVGGFKAFSNYKIKYLDLSGETVRRKTAQGLNMPLLTLDYMVQAGIKDFSIYAKYSPFGLFTQGKGPDVRAVSVGLMLNFDD
jgi:hypothetical protein